MTRIYNREYQKALRQRLRNSATAAERVLWSRLKYSQLSGYKFRRQQGIAQYVVDSYCPACKLAVEIDGATHSTAKEIQHDRIRQRYIESFGVHFLRFTNEDIYENLEWVLEVITRDLHRPTTPNPPPGESGGGNKVGKV